MNQNVVLWREKMWTIHQLSGQEQGRLTACLFTLPNIPPQQKRMVVQVVSGGETALKSFVSASHLNEVRLAVSNIRALALNGGNQVELAQEISQLLILSSRQQNPTPEWPTFSTSSAPVKHLAGISPA